MERKRLGFALCGSFCTMRKALDAMRSLSERYELTPILSETAASTDTRFGTAREHREEAERICGRGAISTLREAEPIGPRKLLDALVICPCTGNTAAKLAGGIADTAVTMAAKAHLRNGRPVVLAISTNDGLSGNLRNLGLLMGRKYIYFVPFGQDDPREKPASLSAELSLLEAAVEEALAGRQLQPVLLGRG